MEKKNVFDHRNSILETSDFRRSVKHFLDLVKHKNLKREKNQNNDNIKEKQKQTNKQKSCSQNHVRKHFRAFNSNEKKTDSGF